MSTTDLNSIRISPLRQRFIDDMELAGLVPGTQKTYINAVLTCVQRCGNLPPERISEQQLEGYIRRRRLEVARGTFQAEFHGLKHLFHRTLGREWSIFTKKKSNCLCASGCRLPSPTTSVSV
ncbi:MAG: phage integrase N-terminal SAM-like domain-containing protein [Planctomycetaceae bacterium]|nr:phage integrase N-terminal SAM-like domain-containing protein [Planctomycetaceae bacterium]